MTCQAPECESKIIANGYCNKHWHECRRLKFQLLAALGLEHCSSAKCFLPVYAKERCQKHYKETLRTKDREIPKEKKCVSCQELKSSSDFHRFSYSKDGLQYECKTCVSKRNKESWEKNAIRNRKVKARWSAANKDWLSKRQKQRRQEDPIKFSIREREYRLRNIEKIREKDRIWTQQNREKVRLAAAKRRARKKKNKTFEVSDKDLRRLMNQNCLYCGGPFEHIEHLIPLSRGGSHGIGNLGPSCAHCNLTKHNKTVFEFKIWRMKIEQRT